MKMASIVCVMGFPTVQAILRSVADAAILNSGVYAIGSSFLVGVIETGKVKPETIFDGEVINGFQ